MMYALVRVGKAVLYSKWEKEAKEEMRKICEEGHVIDMIIYHIDPKPLEVYHKELGEEITPFVLNLYGTVVAKSQGLSKDNINEHIIDIDGRLAAQGRLFEA